MTLTMAECVEDMQMRSLKRIKVFDSEGREQGIIPRHVSTSSRFGLTLILGPKNTLYSCSSSNIHQLGLLVEGEKDISNFPFRITEYHDITSEIVLIDVNSNGSILAVAVNTSNGPFIELFDVLAFAPQFAKKPFPLQTVRISSYPAAKINAFEWNPELNDVFVAACSDCSLSTIQISLENPRTMTILGTVQMKDNCPVQCISWSPKGKQISIGDAAGRVHQFKQELTEIRIIDPPKELPIGSFSCVGICWISTTEWIIVHSSAVNRTTSVSLLEVKKQQAPKWTFFSSLLLKKFSGGVHFCPILSWKVVLLYFSSHSRIEMIGYRGEKWSHFDFEVYDMQLPLDYKKCDIFPLGCCIDFSSIHQLQLETRMVNPQPVVYVLSTSGELLSYAIVPLSERYMQLTKASEACSITNAKFGEPSHAYLEQQKSRISESNLAQPKPQASLFTGLDKNAERSSVPPILAGKTEKQEEVTNTEIEKRKAAEEKKRQIVILQESVEKLVCEYTSTRNLQAQKIDNLRELRCQTETYASSLNFDDELSEVFRDVHISYDEAFFELEKVLSLFQERIQEIHQVKFLFEYFRNPDKEKQGKLSFDERKKLELIQRRYESLLQMYENTKTLFNKLAKSRKSSKISLTRQKLAPIDPDEQKRINESTKSIHGSIAKLATKLGILQRQIGKISHNRPRKPNQEKRANATTSKPKPTPSFCSFRVDEIVLEDKPALSLFNQAVGRNRNHDNQSQLQSNLRKMLMAHSKKPPLIQRVSSQLFELKPAECTKIDPQKTDSRNSELSERLQKLNTPPAKPRLVSVGTQSPSFPHPYPTAHSNRTSNAKAVEVETPVRIPSSKAGARLPSLPELVDSPVIGNVSSSAVKPVDESVAAKSTVQSDVIQAKNKVEDAPSFSFTDASSALKQLVCTAKETGSSGITPNLKQNESTIPETKLIEEKDLKDKVEEQSRLEPKVVPTIENLVSTSTPTKPAPCKTPLLRESFISNEGDVGMEDASNIANASNSAISFNFNQARLDTTPKKPVTTLNSAFSTPSSLFNSPVVNPSNAFGNLGTGTGKKSVFGGGGESNIGSSPFQPSKPVFGAVSFGGGNSAFGGSAKIGAPSASNATGFAAFANKSSAFGELAKSTSPPQSSFSLFGGGAASNANPNVSGAFSTNMNFGQTQSKSPAFTAFRK